MSWVPFKSLGGEIVKMRIININMKLAVSCRYHLFAPGVFPRPPVCIFKKIAFIAWDFFNNSRGGFIVRMSALKGAHGNRQPWFSHFFRAPRKASWRPQDNKKKLTGTVSCASYD